METEKSREEMVRETLERVKETFIEMGCQPEWNGDEVIRVKYQGDALGLIFGVETVRIIDESMGYISADDPFLELLKTVINEANERVFGPSAYTRPLPESDAIMVYAKYDVSWMPPTELLKSFFHDVIKNFFQLKSYIAFHFKQRKDIITATQQESDN